MNGKEWRPTAFVETTPGGSVDVEGSGQARRRELLALLRRLLALDAIAVLLVVTLIADARLSGARHDR